MNFAPPSNVIGQLRATSFHQPCNILYFPFVLLNNPTTTNMCFDDHDTYTTRTYVANGSRYSSEYTRPRYGMSWRRRNGFGGSYYPSRYYNRRPSGRYMSTAMMQQNRYSGYGGYGQGRGYPRGVVAGGYSGHNSYPQGVVAGGYSGYPQCNSYPRGVVAGGYNRNSSGYGRSYPDNRVAMPGHTAMVSLPSFLFSPIASPSRLPSCTPLPSPHWPVWILNLCSGS
jgi:hypothetical protein